MANYVFVCWPYSDAQMSFYKPYFFSQWTLFLFHYKLANSTFNHGYRANRASHQLATYSFLKHACLSRCLIGQGSLLRNEASEAPYGSLAWLSSCPRAWHGLGPKWQERGLDCDFWVFLFLTSKRVRALHRRYNMLCNLSRWFIGWKFIQQMCDALTLIYDWASEFE
jgi:hypothetical protein